MKTTFHSIAIASALALIALSPAAAQQPAAKAAQPAAIPGTLTLKNGAEVTGYIRWLPQARKYVVAKGQGAQAVSQDVPASDVAGVKVNKPDRLDAAINLVKTGAPQKAIPLLEEIVKRYAKLGWDEQAGRWLARARLDTGDTSAALQICEAFVKARPAAAYLGDIAPIYWSALLKANRADDVKKLLVRAIANGSANDSAAALVMRGDILMEEKEPFNALKDGYLRTVLLYENCHDVQPEALYKAAKAFEALSRNAEAQKLREKLLKRYPRSEFAGKI
ncbi:MAG: tetratricopeptide repeat protein [Kiritimatiellae bacterium]|nr:tetratricopeptide repeat protein [Kiritimatiellia bacterium]